MFGTIPKNLWNKVCPADENNLCTLAMRCLLIDEGERRILIDTGIGDKQSEKFFSYYYLHGDDSLRTSLARYGYTTDDITDVILSHLHLDHVGGALENLAEGPVPTFKNATYWSCQEHWNWATDPNPRESPSFLKENILPLAASGKLKFIEKSDSTHFTENISIRFVNGHTDSMMLPFIKYKEHTLVFVADLLPTAAHIPVNYVPAYDVSPLDTMTEKAEFLAEAEENGYILFFEHDEHNECASLKKTDKGIRVDHVFKLEDL